MLFRSVDVHSCHLLFDHFQFALIRGPNIPGSYATLLFTHRTLLPLAVPFTTGCCFCFGSIPSFFLELFPHLSPVTYRAPANLGNSSFSVLSCCLFIMFMGFSGKNAEVVFHFLLLDHLLSELSTMTCPSWVDLHSMAHSFIELDKAAWPSSSSCTALKWWLHGTGAVSTWHWSNCEETLHVQGRRSPSKTVGAGVEAEQRWSICEEITHIQG